MRQLLGTFAFFLMISLTGVFASPAFAEADAEEITRQVEDLSARGADRFRAGNYRAALVLFEEAYGLQPVPNLLYNMGRASEELEEWEPAIEYFERFLTADDVEARAREAALSRIQSIRTRQQATAATSFGDDQTPEPPTAEPPNRTPAFALLGTSAALLTGGIIMGVSASQSANQISDPDLGYDARLDARTQARTHALVADALYLSSAATAAVGIYLLVSAGKSSDQPSVASRSLSPWFGTDGAGFTFQVGF